MRVNGGAKCRISMTQGKTTYTTHFWTFIPLAPTKATLSSSDRHLWLTHGLLLLFHLLFWSPYGKKIGLCGLEIVTRADKKQGRRSTLEAAMKEDERRGGGECRGVWLRIKANPLRREWSVGEEGFSPAGHWSTSPEVKARLEAEARLSPLFRGRSSQRMTPGWIYPPRSSFIPHWQKFLNILTTWNKFEKNNH